MIASRIAFSPPTAEIPPGSEQVFEVILPVGPDFVAGETYLATLSTEGFEAMDIVVRLKVEAAAAETSEMPPTKVPAGNQRPAKRQPATRPVTTRKRRSA